MAGPTGFPLNQSTYIPGGPLVINGTAVGSNNLISFQLNGSEVANLNQSGVLSTAGGGGGVTTMGAFGSSPNANGGSISTVTLTLQPADGTHPGGVSIGAQTFAGAKTFSAASIFSLGFKVANQNAWVDSQGGNVIYPYSNDVIFGSPNTSAAGIWHWRNNSFDVATLDMGTGTTVPYCYTLPYGVHIYGFTDLSGTPGAGTANTASGMAALVMGSASTFKITNSLVTANSLIMLTWNGAPDTTAKIGAVQTSGGFNVVITGTPAAASVFNWLVINSH